MLKLLVNPLSPIHRSYICVCLTDGTARIFTRIPLFLPPPSQVFTLERMTTGIVRESAHGGGTREDRSTINFGHVQV